MHEIENSSPPLHYKLQHLAAKETCPERDDRKRWFGSYVMVGLIEEQIVYQTKSTLKFKSSTLKFEKMLRQSQIKYTKICQLTDSLVFEIVYQTKSNYS